MKMTVGHLFRDTVRDRRALRVHSVTTPTRELWSREGKGCAEGFWVRATKTMPLPQAEQGGREKLDLLRFNLATGRQPPLKVATPWHFQQNSLSCLNQFESESWYRPLFPPALFDLPLLRDLVFLKRLCLFIFKERGREGERGRETSVYGCLLHAPYWGPGLKPRHVPWLGIEPATLCFTVWCSIHWATPARARELFLKEHSQGIILRLNPLNIKAFVINRVGHTHLHLKAEYINFKVVQVWNWEFWLLILLLSSYNCLKWTNYLTFLG